MLKVLPQPCHTVFDRILDYMYGQEITVKAETLEQLFNAAHAGVLHLVCERIFSHGRGTRTSMFLSYTQPPELQRFRHVVHPNGIGTLQEYLAQADG